jgi:homoserine kinase
MMASRVIVWAPATIANLGPGFDVFGLALSKPADVVEGSISRSGMRIKSIVGAGAADLPHDPKKNVVSIAAARVMNILGCSEGLEFKIKKGIKPGGGIGSSGACAAAGAVIANEIFDGGLSVNELIEAAAFAEGKVAGSIHYDNVTPAIVGGFTIVTSTRPFEYIAFDPPRMKIVVAQPAIEVSTRKAREILPKKVPVRNAVANIGRASAMAAALKMKNLAMFGRYMIDSIAEPARARLIPGFYEVKRAAIKAGALGAAMAGSGPTIFAVAESSANAKKIAAAMSRAFEGVGLKCGTIITSPGRGVRILRKR